ncbi:MAG: CPBP family intramembrane metalloprotease [Acidobacteria bacterium]|nr:CPBP family intramembrane metalloprotease [Acidobacteriota bacterium]
MDDPLAPPLPPEITSPVPSLPPPPPAHPVHNIFLGPHGLRAGWRLLIYLAFAFLLVLLARFFLQRLQGVIKVQLWGMMLGEFAAMVVAFVPAWIMARIEKRRFGAYGLPAGTAFRKNFWVGLVWGLVWLTILMLGMIAVHAFHISGLALSGVRILKFAAFYAVFFLLVGFFEEFLMRGYTQFTLTLGMGFWPAAGLLSALFGATHLGNQGESLLGALAAALIGFFFCLTLRRTGDLWFAVGFHASWDWGETYLFSVPNSGNTMTGHLLNVSFQGPAWLTGGSVGPEGSVLILLLIAALWFAFHRLYPGVNYHPETS